ncbi:DUF4065 domain-containing protein [Collinsella sp. zg1085]|uniref:Panacea domain-containing protein n=1 Tax=Collinsella sp. zg1085 TaxID=2844380 RepID=UPI001C0E5FA6|nr:type II toxin-antitoxin system antitoxin SocA domain-containing protein [Collinsella sp. zg1085]QWT17266.1 DUF4065 domain-containing protein [Collinsella sp. zg1085]
MVNSIDIAAFILEQTGSMTTMKLQKLVFYTQAYYLVKHGKPLFEDEIQAWVNGPVSPNLYRHHAGKYMICKAQLEESVVLNKLSCSEQETARFVIAKLGEFSGEELRELSHSEAPWVNAREGLLEDERGNRVITVDAILNFYSSKTCSNPIFS